MTEPRPETPVIGEPPTASRQDGSYPRPQLMRAQWTDLSGPWQFRVDDDDAGTRERWQRDWPEPSDRILVPFPPESPASGIADTAYHPIVWYRCRITGAGLDACGFTCGNLVVIHFGAVDYRATVWANGELVGRHEGGHSPFSIDITDQVDADRGVVIVVRAEDDPLDVTQPRGKQDWQLDPHVVWYHRTTGIWQPVWLEAVPDLHIEKIRWTTDAASSFVGARLRLSARPAAPVPVSVELSFDGELLAELHTTAVSREPEIAIHIPALENGQAVQDLVWSPEHPRLIDAVVRAGDDAVSSYLGVTSTRAHHGAFLLNGQPRFVRSVLDQGYWPQSSLTAPSASALRSEVELIKALGFNAVRLHQKYEDPRMLYWADRLGLMVWGEAPAAYAFTPEAVRRTVSEWQAIVDRDYSHPSIVTWVPVNESWGVQSIATDPAQQEFVAALVHLTRALDATRPVVGNDGWEQVDTDIVTIHDYDSDPARLRSRYADDDGLRRAVSGIGPGGRVSLLSGDVDELPVMLTEFGGISFNTQERGWGYTSAASPDEFRARLSEILAAVNDSTALAGFCYTQLADTGQETNGLLTGDRAPKLPVGELRRMILDG